MKDFLGRTRCFYSSYEDEIVGVVFVAFCISVTFAALSALITYDREWRAQRERCASGGGVMLRTAEGFECVKAEVLR